MLQTPVASSYIPFSGTGKKPSDGENTPFRMVAEDQSKMLPSDFKTTTIDNRALGYSGALYNQRAQKAVGRDDWRENVVEAVRKCGIPTDMLAIEPPSSDLIETRFPNEDKLWYETRYQAELALYQELNTKVWDVVRPSIDLHGAFEKSDRDLFRQTMMNGDLRDGAALYKWALSFGAGTDLKSQLQLTKEAVF